MDKIATIAGGAGLGQADALLSNSEAAKVKELASRKVSTEKETDKAASGFEALLLHQMLKAMWSTVQTTGLLGENSNEAQVYRDMLDQAIADNVAEGRGVGVKKFLKKELLKSESKHHKVG